MFPAEVCVASHNLPHVWDPAAVQSNMALCVPPPLRCNLMQVKRQKAEGDDEASGSAGPIAISDR